MSPACVGSGRRRVGTDRLFRRRSGLVASKMAHRRAGLGTAPVATRCRHATTCMRLTLSLGWHQVVESYCNQDVAVSLFSVKNFSRGETDLRVVYGQVPVRQEVRARVREVGRAERRRLRQPEGGREARLPAPLRFCRHGELPDLPCNARVNTTAAAAPAFCVFLCCPKN